MNLDNFIHTIEKAVIQKNSTTIIYSLLHKNVYTDMPNKIRFYSFFKKSVLCLHKTSKGIIKMKVNAKLDKSKLKIIHLDFYDTYYTNPRLTIQINKIKNQLKVFTLPF